MSFLIFPGQGSQHPGMGKFLFDEFKEAKQVFEEASDSLKIDIKKLCFEGSQSDLTLTENTQPALLTTSMATQRVLHNSFGIKPALSAGHSVGEYAAVVTAGVIEFSDAVKAVRVRGLEMQNAVPIGEGGMAAIIGLEDEQVVQLCQFVEKESTYTPLSAANFNCPGQVVVSGSLKSINWLSEKFEPGKLWGETGPKKVRIIPLNVSAPFHCSMMSPAESKMREVLSKIEFSEAKFPIIQNFDADPCVDANLIRENLIRQVSAPVLWTQCMNKAMSFSPKLIIEVGAGKVLQGLFKKIKPEVKVFTTQTIEDLKELEKIHK